MPLTCCFDHGSNEHCFNFRSKSDSKSNSKSDSNTRLKLKTKQSKPAEKELKAIKDQLLAEFLQQKQQESLTNHTVTQARKSQILGANQQSNSLLLSSTNSSTSQSESDNFPTLDFSDPNNPTSIMPPVLDSSSKADVALEREISSLLDTISKEQLDLLKARCRDKLYNLLGVYKSKFNDTKIKEPKLKFALKSRTIAGIARYPDEIDLNIKFLIQEGDHFIDNVVGHEFAHFIVFYLIANKQLPRKVKPHGKEWKYFMNLFGIEPNVYHSYDVEHRVKRQFRYVCSCQEHFLTATRHNRIKKGTKYSCRKCKEILRFEPLNRANSIDDQD